MLYADDRRIGDHGIGRFAREVLAHLDYCPVGLNSNPNSPLDPFRLARALRGLRPGDLFFSPGYNPPLRCPVPFLFTLHDLNHIDRPENGSVLKRVYYERIIKRACRMAACVLTVSDFSRRRIVAWADISPQKVANVGNGVSSNFNPNVAPYRFSTPYVLCVSNRKKHKNEFRQLEAFAAASLDKGLALVFTGDTTPDLTDCISRNGLAGRVHFLGRVEDEQLPSLYRGAQALMFVSLYEGFGLPVIEAMACGTPVLTSNSTALPEIAGDAALLVDPNSVEQIAVALKRILSDSTLRQNLRNKGVARSAQFTWSRTVTDVRNALELTATAAGEN